MKASLYAIRHRDAGWSWRLSLDMRVDAAHWSACGEGEDGVVRLLSPVSLGQAIWLKQWLARSAAVNKALDERAYETVRREMTRRLAVLGASTELMQRLELVEGWEAQRKGDPTPSLVGGDSRGAAGTARSPSKEAAADTADVQVVGRLLEGRMLLKDELLGLLHDSGLGHWQSRWASLVQAAYLRGCVELSAGVDCSETRRLWRRGRQYACRRCGSGDKRMYWAPCMDCGVPCPYCEACLTMGRARFCSLLVLGVCGGGVASDSGAVSGGPAAEAAALPTRTPAQAGTAAWRSASPQLRAGARDADAAGYEAELRALLQRWKLSPAQTEASLAGLRFLRERPAAGVAGAEPACFLYWAVTGAGKTEMIFPLIACEVARGGRVLVATPRRDVVLELQPRLAAAFPANALVTLYGGSAQRWERGEITLATTHQLLRFWRRFDLVILDEIDAYPFHNNPMLEHAARQACKLGGRYVLLSATPPLPLQQAASRRRLGHAKVPVRFHRQPLPVPHRVRAAPVERWLRQGQIPALVMDKLRASLQRGAQLFLFVPRIRLVEPLVLLLQRELPDVAIRGTSSQDAERTEKVADFRLTDIRLLVTTTILERGVTVPRSDVFVLDADSGLFDEAALVQMAGRAGRSRDDPHGLVCFVAADYTASQQRAIRHIRRMNRLAAAKGYLQTKEGNDD